MHRLRKTNLILSLMMLSLVSIGFSSWVFSSPEGGEISFDASLGNIEEDINDSSAVELIKNSSLTIQFNKTVDKSVSGLESLADASIIFALPIMFKDVTLESVSKLAVEFDLNGLNSNWLTVNGSSLYSSLSISKMVYDMNTLVSFDNSPLETTVNTSMIFYASKTQASLNELNINDTYYLNLECELNYGRVDINDTINDVIQDLNIEAKGFVYTISVYDYE